MRTWLLTIALMGCSKNLEPVDSGDTGDSGDSGDTDVVDPLRIPAGTLAYSIDEEGCPDGWTEFADARGRALVGAADADGVGVVVGDPLDGLMPHLHGHTVGGSLTIDNAGVAAASGCCNNSAGAAGVHETTGAVDDDGAGLPTIALRVCRRNGTTDEPSSGAPVPDGTAAFFDRDECPLGWTLLEDGVGRFAVGIAGGSLPLEKVGDPLQSGEDRQHTHAATLSVSVPENSLAAASGSNTSPALKGTYDVDVISGEGGSGLPYVQALLCQVDAPGVATGDDDEAVPGGIVAWSVYDDCDDGWVEHSTMNGRFPIGLPLGIDVGDTYGDALAEGEEVTHTHTGALSVDIPSAPLAIASGCCLSDPGAAGTFSVSVAVEEASTGLPTVSLQACRKQ